MKIGINNISLRPKLFIFVVLAVLLVLTLVGTGLHYYANIQRANGKKDELNNLAKALQRLQLVDKAYQREKSEAHKARFGELAASLQQGIQALQASAEKQVRADVEAVNEAFKQYTQIFEQLTQTVEENRRVEAVMVKPMQNSEAQLDNIVIELEKKQAILQMEGEVLNDNELEMLNVVRDCKISILELQNIQHQFLKNGDQALLEAFKTKSENETKVYLVSLESFAQGLNNKQIEDSAAQVTKAIDEFLGYVAQIQKLGAQEMACIDTLDQLGQQMLEKIDGIVQVNIRFIQSEIKTALKAVIGIVVAGLLVFLAVSIVLVRVVTRPISQVLSGLKEIAEGDGDLTRRLQVQSKDELGQLANYFNLFTEKIQGLIRQVANNAKQVDGSSKELLGISEQMTAGSEQTSSKANTVAAAGVQMSDNMRSVAEAMAQAADNVSMVVVSTEEMTTTIANIARNAEQSRDITNGAVEQASTATQRVADLGSAAQDIGKVVETITEISAQVNLLALNATIEAARAGDAGKGFAVVANEIKELANETAEATGEIKKQVEAIQGSTSLTVSDIDKITETVGQVFNIVSTIASAVEEQSATTTEISKNISNAAKGIEDVNAMVSSSSAMADQIAGEIGTVNTAADEISTNSNKVNAKANALDELSRELNALVDRFKI